MFLGEHFDKNMRQNFPNESAAISQGDWQKYTGYDNNGNLVDVGGDNPDYEEYGMCIPDVSNPNSVYSGKANLKIYVIIIKIVLQI